MATATTPRLVESLRERAESTPDRVAYEFVDADGHVDALTYRELAARAAHVAERLRDAAPEPGATLLLFPPGFEYVCAVYGCLLAGVPAVPAYPPEPWRLEAGIARLERIVADARPTTVLASSLLSPLFSTFSPELAASVLTIEDWPEADEPRWDVDAPGRHRSDVAIVQYTSGSTKAPKGVLVRHANLEHNIAAIAAAFRLDEESRGFIWLPPYHDMGLVGGILTPLQVGFPVRLMSPLDFLKRPTLWLRQISDMRATASGGPNFAYELCLRRPPEDDELQRLDLSSWAVAFNGAEPVRWRTLEAFARRFAPAGFRASAFFPCYGLAEATLIVSGGHWDRTVVCASERLPVDRLTEDEERSARVSAGVPLADQDLVVVEPTALHALPEGAEGEICLHGPSVASGYLGTSDDELFVEIDGVRYLRTGDLGYLTGGELVITGRLTDVIVHRGVNYHASDVEEAAVAGVADLRPVAAAFAIDAEPEPVLAIVVEARPSAGDPEQVAAGVRARTLEDVGLGLNVVVVAPPGTVPRTTSGKVQRHLARERLLAGEYDDHLAYADEEAARAGEQLRGGQGAALEALVDLTCGVFAAVCGAEACRPDETLFELGGDSLRAAEIASVLEDAFELPVPLDLVLLSLTPAALAEQLLTRWRGDGVRDDAVLERIAALRRVAEPSAA